MTPKVDASIKNYEPAFRDAVAVPDLCDISTKTEANARMYGVDDADKVKSATQRPSLVGSSADRQGRAFFVELSCLTPTYRSAVGRGQSVGPTRVT